MIDQQFIARINGLGDLPREAVPPGGSRFKQSV
jgi:hypothetical protein